MSRRTWPPNGYTRYTLLSFSVSLRDAPAERDAHNLKYKFAGTVVVVVVARDEIRRLPRQIDRVREKELCPQRRLSDAFVNTPHYCAGTRVHPTSTPPPRQRHSSRRMLYAAAAAATAFRAAPQEMATKYKAI